jgi:tight adherence protein B
MSKQKPSDLSLIEPVLDTYAEVPGSLIAILQETQEAYGYLPMDAMELISQRTGSPLMALFQRSAVLVERQGEFERLLSVKTAQVRLSARIVCLLPAVMVAGLSLISHDFQHGLLTPVGMGSVLVAALMDGVALLIIRRLMEGVL